MMSKNSKELAVELATALEQAKLNEKVVDGLWDEMQSLRKLVESQYVDFKATGKYFTIKQIAMLLPRRATGKYYSESAAIKMLMGLGYIEDHMYITYDEIGRNDDGTVICDKYLKFAPKLTNLGYKYGVIKGVAHNRKDKLYNCYNQKICFSDEIVPILIQHMKQSLK